MPHLSSPRSARGPLTSAGLLDTAKCNTPQSIDRVEYKLAERSSTHEGVQALQTASGEAPRPRVFDHVLCEDLTIHIRNRGEPGPKKGRHSMLCGDGRLEGKPDRVLWRKHPACDTSDGQRTYSYCKCAAVLGK